jgi:hypothetical protein
MPVGEQTIEMKEMQFKRRTLLRARHCDQAEARLDSTATDHGRHVLIALARLLARHAAQESTSQQ